MATQGVSLWYFLVYICIIAQFGSSPLLEGEIKEMIEEVNSSMIHSIYCYNFYKCHNIPLSGTTIKIKKKKKE
jgi:hypothetical protein